MGGYLVDPCLWSDPRFRAMTDAARTLYLSLLTGPARKRVPGLLCIGPAALAEQLDRSQSDTQSALDVLVRCNLAQWDPNYRVVRLPEATGVCQNPNILSRWYSDWLEIPPSPLRAAHLATIAKLVPRDPRKNEKLCQRWHTTFGPELAQYERSLNPTSGLTDYTSDGTSRPLPAEPSDSRDLNSCPAPNLSGGSDQGFGSGRGRGIGINSFGNSYPNCLSAGQDTESAPPPTIGTSLVPHGGVDDGIETLAVRPTVARADRSAGAQLSLLRPLELTEPEQAILEGPFPARDGAFQELFPEPGTSMPPAIGSDLVAPVARRRNKGRH